MTDEGASDLQTSALMQTKTDDSVRSLRTSLSHQILTLIGVSFLCFELIFLTLYFDKFWFSVDIIALGIPAVFLSLTIGHLFLSLAESNLACRMLNFWLKGKPAVVYRKWLSLNDRGLAFGAKYIRWHSIDELNLTLLGNIVVRSRLLCGIDAPFSDEVLKFPLAVADLSVQEDLLAEIIKRRPSVVLNKRLSSRKAVLHKGAQAAQLMSAAIMFFVLLDLGFSSFYYLELIKNYYIAETCLLENRSTDAENHFNRAEELRLHPLPFSWVSSKFLANSSVSAGIWEERARVLALQGKVEEAIENSRVAVKEAPSNLRHRLFLTRLLVSAGRTNEAREQSEAILKDHKHSFMPRLYILAMAKDSAARGLSLAQEYKAQLDACYEDTYEGEPHWPPGGNRYFMELFYSEDSRFLLDRFLGSSYQAKQEL